MTPKPKPRKDTRRTSEVLDLHYSGDASEGFWKRVNRLPRPDQDTLYFAGCLLQNMEDHILRVLQQAEANALIRAERCRKGGR